MQLNYARSQQLLVSTLLLHAQDLQHGYFSSVNTKDHHVSIVNGVFSALHLSLPDLKLFCDHFSKFLQYKLSKCYECRYKLETDSSYKLETDSIYKLETDSSY